MQALSRATAEKMYAVQPELYQTTVYGQKGEGYVEFLELLEGFMFEGSPVFPVIIGEYVHTPSDLNWITSFLPGKRLSHLSGEISPQAYFRVLLIVFHQLLLLFQERGILIPDRSASNTIVNLEELTISQFDIEALVTWSSPTLWGISYRRTSHRDWWAKHFTDCSGQGSDPLQLYVKEFYAEMRMYFFSFGRDKLYDLSDQYQQEVTTIATSGGWNEMIRWLYEKQAGSEADLTTKALFERYPLPDLKTLTIN